MFCFPPASLLHVLALSDGSKDKYKSLYAIKAKLSLTVWHHAQDFTHSVTSGALFSSDLSSLINKYLKHGHLMVMMRLDSKTFRAVYIISPR